MSPEEAIAEAPLDESMAPAPMEQEDYSGSEDQEVFVEVDEAHEGDPVVVEMSNDAEKPMEEEYLEEDSEEAPTPEEPMEAESEMPTREPSVPEEDSVAGELVFRRWS